MFTGRYRTLFIVVTVVGLLALAAGLASLIYWLVTRNGDYTVISICHHDSVETALAYLDFPALEGEGIGDVPYTAALTRIRNAGDMFWWFYPTVASEPHSRPIILWLDGVTGLPPSLLANFGMFGPYDFNLNRRNDSWINSYNLLFIDAPLGTGFSTASDNSRIPTNLDENAEHLALTLQSFYTTHDLYRDTPLYIFGQAHGAQLALALATKLHDTQRFALNLRGVALGNGIVAPAVAMTKLGFYLEELGYIDGNGRIAIETLSSETNALVNIGQLGDAFDKFASLGDFVNVNAGAVAVNLGHIVEKLTTETSRDYFGQRKYLRDMFGRANFELMDDIVAPALGIPSGASFDGERENVLEAFRDSFMIPAIDKIEYILENTELSVSIYNGNLDAVSNTPGQLEWVDRLQWAGQTEFRNSSRQTLAVNRLVEGYFRETQRLRFYWFNAAGQSVPIDSPAAMSTVLQRIVN